MGGSICALVALGCVFVPVSAQSSTLVYSETVTSSGAAASSTASSGPKIVDVTVNKGGTHRFAPEEIEANVGDVISFYFFPTNHSVVKAEYGFPCVPYNYVEPGTKDMFYSGNRLMQATDAIQEWNLTVNSTEPVFFYCSALESCNKGGMLGVINSNKTMTLDYQRALALSENTIQLSPGDPIPAEASSTIIHSTSAVPTSTSSSTPTSTPTIAPVTTNHGHHGLSGGAIAGIAIGGVAVLLLCGLLFFYMGRTKSLKDVLRRNSATVPVSQTPQDPSYGYGFVGQQSPHDYYRQSSHLPPYGHGLYAGPPSEAPGSQGFTQAEFAGVGSPSTRPKPMHKPELARPKPQQQEPAELV